MNSATWKKYAVALIVGLGVSVSIVVIAPHLLGIPETTAHWFAGWLSATVYLCIANKGDNK